MLIQAYGVPKSNRSVITPIMASTNPPLAPQVVANNNRMKLCIFNGSATLKFYVAFGSVIVSTVNYTILLNPGDYFEDTHSVDAISVVSSGTSLTDFLFVTEMS